MPTLEKPPLRRLFAFYAARPSGPDRPIERLPFRIAVAQIMHCTNLHLMGYKLGNAEFKEYTMSRFKFAKKWFNADQRNEEVNLRQAALRESNVGGFNLLTFAARSAR
jgi:hypothetical protein